MTLATGNKLGPYEISGTLGAAARARSIEPVMAGLAAPLRLKYFPPRSQLIVTACSAAIRFNGSVVYAMVRARGGTFRLPLGIMLLLHTHPYGARPLPSDADKVTAKKIAAPNCVVSAKEVWCAMPDGKVVPGVLVVQTYSALAARHLRSREIRVTVGRSASGSAFFFLING